MTLPKLKKKTWYGMFECFSRGESWRRKVKGEFLDDEKPEIIMAVLANNAYFPNNDDNEYEEYMNSAGEKKPFFLGDTTTELFGSSTKGKNSYYCCAEEWNGAISTTQLGTRLTYPESQPEGDFDGEW